MMSFHFTTALLGLGLAVVILFLVRRDHLRLNLGLFWIAAAVAAALLGAWPGLVDRAAAVLGIAYPPALLLLCAVIVLLIKSLQSDIELTRTERQLRRLNQRIALLEVDKGRAGR